MGESPEERVIRSYLLGEMTAEERTAFQQRIFSEEGLFEQVCEAEHDLTDDLARGKLAQADASRVRAFLSESGQQAGLLFSQALAHVNRRGFRRRVPNWQWAVPLAACLLLAPAAALLELRNQRLQDRLARLEQRPAAPAIATPGIYTARIPAGVLRGGTRPAPIHPPANAILELRLEIRAAGAYGRYRVDIARPEGQPLLSLTVPGPLGAELPVVASSTALPPGEYEITLSGIDADGALHAIEYYNFSLQ